MLFTTPAIMKAYGFILAKHGKEKATAFLEETKTNEPNMDIVIEAAERYLDGDIWTPYFSVINKLPFGATGRE